MELISRLEQEFRTLENPTIEQIKGLFNSLSDLLKQAPKYSSDPGSLPYSRKTLFRNDAVEAVVVQIPAGRATAIHGHGNSIGCVFVIEGEFMNTTYLTDKYGYPVQAGQCTVKTGETLIVPAGLIHQMSNTGREAMISVHVYSPPLHNMMTYFPYSEVLDFVI
ncbi:cysteine dioxygenase [Paenibacillus eucommiae]|uniref:Cysteine dioxygenase n=1 Tax=Paenibacillus eucommiae TaxID=1355755 RepID=A0ABS4J4M6_9BACL|nr:cysteine dioxygenase family protein [Paenibacillus eucommiae]MBP1994792.1 cysteine dioxygenase [Paenibacillus eucommiae]